jgi:hypothetical protein
MLLSRVPPATIKTTVANPEYCAMAASTKPDNDTPQGSHAYSQPAPLLQNGDAEKNTLTADSSEKSTREYPSGIARILILGPVTLTYFLFFLDLAVVSTAAPAITSEFNSLIDVGWYVNLFAVSLT